MPLYRFHVSTSESFLAELEADNRADAQAKLDAMQYAEIELRYGVGIMNRYTVKRDFIEEIKDDGANAP